MDSFINLAKQGIHQYQESQNSQHHSTQQTPHSEGEYNKTGGQEYNSPDHSGGGRPHNSNHIPDIDDDHVVSTAKESHESEQSDLFSQGLAFVKGQMGNGGSHEIDEEHLQRAHSEAYKSEGNASKMDASSLGAAAAMQALKQFTSSGGSSDSRGKSGGNTQSTLIGMAMAEASKLFDKSGGAKQGTKQDAINGAAGTVMKFLIKSKFSQATGGSNSGGLGQLMGLAGKFL